METKVTEPEVKETETQTTKETKESEGGAIKAFFKNLFKEDLNDQEKQDDAKQEDKTETTTKTEEKPAQEDFTERLAKEKEKWEAELAEQQRIAKLSPEEKSVEETKKDKEKIAALEKRLNESEWKKTAINMLTKEEYPTGLAELVHYDSEEAMQKSLETVKSVFADCLKEAIKIKLQGKTPLGLGDTKHKVNDMNDRISRAVKG